MLLVQQFKYQVSQTCSDKHRHGPFRFIMRGVPKFMSIYLYFTNRKRYYIKSIVFEEKNRFLYVWHEIKKIFYFCFHCYDTISLRFVKEYRQNEPPLRNVYKKAIITPNQMWGKLINRDCILDIHHWLDIWNSVQCTLSIIQIHIVKYKKN